tara:strand:- start:168 stop:440 length:273 start_codon:yes stop_codon:yes gene_type:complete
MDKPSLDSLHELTGDGTQTILEAAVVSGAVNFYRLDFILDSVFDEIDIQGVDQVPVFGVNVMKAGTSIYNVTSVTLASGIAIGFTAPALT